MFKHTLFPLNPPFGGSLLIPVLTFISLILLWVHKHCISMIENMFGSISGIKNTRVSFSNKWRLLNGQFPLRRIRITPHPLNRLLLLLKSHRYQDSILHYLQNQIQYRLIHPGAQKPPSVLQGNPQNLQGLHQEDLKDFPRNLDYSDPYSFTFLSLTNSFVAPFMGVIL